ncbi:gem-associated protein 8-like [Homarus americanus]|uniref:gem-associated protein 8-like n=1 Tax=Homarus americanus TaxID=6706 RepID=UPI001C438503|nr:gem-associated protein 8-like [Homarus americanus]
MCLTRKSQSDLRLVCGEMSQSRRLVAAAATLVIMKDLKKKKRKKGVWVREWIARRNEEGAHAKLLRELLDEDAVSYKHFLRMCPEDYDYLLEKVTPKIKRQDTHLRKAITPSERLMLTLRFLASGDSYHSLMYTFRIPVTTISKIIPEVCEALYEVLKEDYLKMNDKKEECTKGTQNFWYSDKRYAQFWQHYNTMMMTAHRDAIVRARYVAAHTKAALSSMLGSLPVYLQQNVPEDEMSHQSLFRKYHSSTCSTKSLADATRTNKNRRKRKRKLRNRRKRALSNHNNQGVISDTEILHSQMSRGMHIQEDADDEEDMEVTEDFLKFLEQSTKHRKQWKDRKGFGGPVTSPEEPGADTGPKEHPDVVRSREMQQLYGQKSAKIHAMETALQLSFDRLSTLYQPQYWPNIPFNVMFK